MMLEVDDLDQDTLDALGWHVAGREPLLPRVSLLEAFPKMKRPRRPRMPRVKSIERETGKFVTALTVAPDGSRTYALGEKVDTPFKIETPEQLRKLI